MTSSITSLVTSKWCWNDINVTSNWCQFQVKFWSNNWWRQFFPLTFDVKIDVKIDENFDIKLTSTRQQNDDKMTSKTSTRHTRAPEQDSPWMEETLAYTTNHPISSTNWTKDGWIYDEWGYQSTFLVNMLVLVIYFFL